MAYRAPVEDMRFVLDAVIGAGRLAATDRFAEATPETVEAVLDRGRPPRRGRARPPPPRRRPRARTPRERRRPHHPRLRRGLPHPRRGRLDRHRRAGRARRHGPAGDPRHLPRRDVRLGEPRPLALPHADARRDRGARPPRPGGDQGALPPQARRRHLDRHDEPHRAAGGLGRRRRPRPRRAARDGTYAITGQKSSSPGATTTSPRTSATSSSPASPTPSRAPVASRSSSSPSSSPTRTAGPACAMPSAPSRSSTSSASTAARPA